MNNENFVINIAFVLIIILIVMGCIVVVREHQDNEVCKDSGYKGAYDSGVFDDMALCYRYAIDGEVTDNDHGYVFTRIPRE